MSTKYLLHITRRTPAARRCSRRVRLLLIGQMLRDATGFINAIALWAVTDNRQMAEAEKKALWR
jgi:hypothetical protein